MEKKITADFSKIPGIGPRTAETLEQHGFGSLQKLANSNAEAIAQLPGFSAVRAEKCITEAKTLIAGQVSEKESLISEAPPSPPEEKQKVLPLTLNNLNSRDEA